MGEKIHAVCVPSPYQSHIKAMLKLSKLLHGKGFHITFVNTEFNDKLLSRSRSPDSVPETPDFQFETIPDGLPPSDSDSSQDLVSICDSITKNFLAPFRNLLAKLNSDAATSRVPPVTCIIADGFLVFAATAAEEVGVPLVNLFTVSACSFMGFYQFGALLEKGLTPLEDASYLTNGYLEEVIDWIPGMKDIRLKDLPSFLRTTDSNDLMFRFCLDAAQAAHRASSIIFHTFDELERDVLSALSNIFPDVYPIGPFQLLLNQTPEEEDKVKLIGYNLWKEESDGLKWLDSKETGSVIYVNFGSVEELNHEEMMELAWGLANSEHYFLWVIRIDLVDGGSGAGGGVSASLLAEVVAETKGRGLITGWCPQEEVLSHSALGGFLTHCGWNSILESLSAGVPLLCCPVKADQPTNCRYACREWEVGIEIEKDLRRDEVERGVRELMGGETGKRMRTKASQWKKMTEVATGPEGSSTLNLDKLVKKLSQPKKYPGEVSSHK